MMTPTRKSSRALEENVSPAKKVAKRRSLTPEESELAIAFGLRLEALLKDSRFKSSAEFARELGVDPSTMSQWTRGKVQMPRVPTFLRACDLLGDVRPHYLAYGQEPRTYGALAAQSQLRLQVLADEGALGGRSLDVVANLLQSRDFYTQCEIPNASECSWHIVNDKRLAPMFMRGDRLVIHRARQQLEEGWLALVVRSRILIREVVRISDQKTTFRDGQGKVETLATVEVGCYGAVLSAVRKFETA